ncbi:hypothetical protein Ccrd_001206 [Cynara cardunculus var. scolymus]|uniref:Cation/H+ exchanger transmembrane domain-containing protein n=1 Tax=Cynara cardunculus var. scolymus TaxID=59895 RepID=A0A103XTS5_CYNCS|nr:hypothetical protein Ccrd_001206 [Cynara cardunculus var. scolymus]
MDELQISPADHGGTPGKDQQAAGVGILLQIMMLVLSFILGHVLRRHRFYYLPEASASLLIGLIVGGLANISNTETSIRYLGGAMYLMYRLPLVECLMFGALISATDPVTVLSIFQELGTDTNLYALVFGESVLNDAVSLILISTIIVSYYVAIYVLKLILFTLVYVFCHMLDNFEDGNFSVQSHSSSGENFFLIVVRFLETFVGSMSAAFVPPSFETSEIKKNSTWYQNISIPDCFSVAAVFQSQQRSRNKHLQNLECCLFVLFPYFSYMLAEGLGLSGIVSILFTGMVMKHYSFSNLSENSQRFVAAFFHLISSLAETFVFIYMGFDIAMEQHSWSHVGFIFFSIIFIGLARAANVFTCAYLLNLVRPAQRQIPVKHQKALWYSGLRGAMAFALALQSVHELPEGHGQTIFTATTAIVVLTVLLIGGSTGTMLEALQVVGDNHEGHLTDSFESNIGYVAPFDGESTSGNRLKMRLKEFHRSAASFRALDRNYLTPFFTTQTGDRDDNDDSHAEDSLLRSRREGFH